jgi:chromosome segregation ATPase
MSDIADLLEEVHTLVQGLLAEKTMLQDRIKMLENEISTTKEAKNTVTRELKETREKLEREIQATKEKLDHVHPEMQSLQNALENTEVQTNLLLMDLQRKDAEIKALELRLSEYTSLIPSSFQMNERI